MFLSEKLKTTIYSHLQFLFIFAKKVHPYIQSGKQEPEINRFLVEYYKNHYLLHMSEIYTFFYSKNDTSLLSRFELSEEKRLRLKKVRHYYAHLKSDVDDYLLKADDFLADLEPNVVEKDLMRCVGQAKKIFHKIPEIESNFKKEIKEIFDLYPSDFFMEEIKNIYYGNKDCE